MSFDVSRDEGGKIDAHTVPELRRGNMAKKGWVIALCGMGSMIQSKTWRKMKTNRGGCSSTHPYSSRLDKPDETSLIIRQVRYY